MKRAVRPLFSVLLLIVFAVTLSCRTVVHRGSSSFELETTVVLPKPPAPALNTTLLKFAAIDASEPQLKKEIEQLLDDNFGSHRMSMTFANWRRFNIRDVRANGLPSSIRSPAFYRYWLAFRRALSDWARRKRYEPEIMSELVGLVKHPLDSHYGLVPSDRRYSSCAVVGNSGILLKSEYGELIDSHEIVIRLNNARTANYERNVGSKTSISFINSNILHICSRRGGCYCHPYGPNVPIVMYVCQPVHLLDYTICNSSHISPLLITDPRFDMLCARIVKYYSLKLFAEETGKPLEEWGNFHDGPMFHYSSGMQAVMLALGICDKVSVFGFGKSGLAKHHYHTNQKAELGLHHYDAEYALYRDLMENPQEVPFLSPNFKVPPMVMYH